MQENTCLKLLINTGVEKITHLRPYHFLYTIDLWRQNKQKAYLLSKTAVPLPGIEAGGINFKFVHFWNEISGLASIRDKFCNLVLCL